MKTAKQLREKYESDLRKLQEKCPHKKSTWMEYHFSVGRIWGEVLVCDRCEKIIDRRPPDTSNWTITVTNWDKTGSTIVYSNENS